MSPPVPGVLPRTVHDGYEIIDGQHISSGITIGACAYSVHHNEKYIANPYDYFPERWLEEKVSIDTVRQIQSVFVPFSIRPRSCAGKKLAMLEITLALAPFSGSLISRLTTRREI
jgi:cytochrome P450